MRFRLLPSLLLGIAVSSAGLAQAATLVPTITAAGSAAHIPLGVFSTTVTGTNFTTTSVVNLCGANVPTTYVSATSLKITGVCSKAGATSLYVLNGSTPSKAFAVKIGIDNPKCTPEAARRFLEQAAFGPSPSDALAVQTLGMSAWIDQQFAMPQTSTYTVVKTAYGGMATHFMTDAVMQPDQLRQRVGFALSQIWVTSLVQLVNANMIPYQDMLLADSFTNYKTIMTDVTMSPQMGQYLNMANNAKADPATGSLANENYARELMQLFTIGVNKLNQDGSTVLSGGQPVPNYSQFTVTEFARAFTGWTYKPANNAAIKWPGNTPASYVAPMVPYPAQHDTGSKTLLNGFVLPAGQTPQADLTAALNNIFLHSNVGPFVSRMLISHLVKSNPSPAYISRVAGVFNNNGSGVRGDMKAVIKAILLDTEARANDENTDQLATDGHLQEPALFLAGMYRAFQGTIDDTNNYQWYLSTVGEPVFSSQDVFNYYDWDGTVPGTTLTGGEFEINTPNAAVLRANFVQGLFGAYSNPVQHAGNGTMVDLTPYVYLGAYPSQLVDALDLALTHGTMPAEMKSIITTAVQNVNEGGNLRKVQKGAYLILTSGYYNVWH